MSDIFYQIIWMSIITMGTIIYVLPEFFRKNENANKRYRRYSANFGITHGLLIGGL